MSDYETLRDMIQRAQERGTMVNSFGNPMAGIPTFTCPADIEFNGADKTIKVEAGYSYFFSFIKFNEKGELLSIEAFE